MNNPYAMYQSNAISALSQEDILLQLLEGAIVRIKQARQLSQEGDKAKAREKRTSALNIVTELDSTLDRKNEAQDVVENLEALYAFMISEINQSALEDDLEKLSPVQEVLQDLYQGFQVAVQEEKHKTVAEKSPPEASSTRGSSAIRARG